MTVFSPYLAFNNRHILAKKIPPIRLLLAELGEGLEDDTCEDCDKGKVSLIIYNYIIGRIKDGHYLDTKNTIDCLKNVHDDIVFVIDKEVYNEEKLLIDGFFLKEKPMPGFLFSIKNAFQSFFHIFYKFFTKGDFFVDKDIRKERLDMCLNCEFYCPKSKKCTECTCPVYRKTKFKHSSCPNDFWNS
jgi:hypothetical protein